MTAGFKIAIAAAASLLLLIVVIAAAASAVMAAHFDSGFGGRAAACATTGTPTTDLSGYSHEQIGHAATIVAVGKRMHVPERGWLIAISTALQESALRNLDHGDRDSLGLFQQRPSQGWGTPAQLTDPAYAATMFYRHLLDVPGWQHMSVYEAAQAVQRSATPGAYGRHESDARAITAAVGGATCIPAAAPGHVAARAISFAQAQIGQPYLWGGDGPTNGDQGFDCSGLTAAAYAAAGVEIPRTAQTQFNAGPRVPASQPVAPGDLVFFGASPDSVTHVGLAISDSEMINAPHRGAPVRVDSIWRPNYLGATRPAN